MNTNKIFMRRRPMVAIVLGTATIVSVALWGVPAGSAATGAHPYQGPAPGAVTCQLKGTITFSPKLSASGRGSPTSRLKGGLWGCDTSDSAVTINSARLDGTFASSPLNCATVSGTGVPATWRVTWNGELWGQGANFSPTDESSTRSEVVTAGSGDEGIATPGGGRSSTSGSFASKSGSSANAYTKMTRRGLSSMCRSRRGIRKLVVTGTVTIGSRTATGGSGGSSTIPLGDYAGSDNASGLAAFGYSTGTHVTYATDYLDQVDGWSGLAGASIVKGWEGSGYRLVLGVPIIPKNEQGDAQGTLAAGATGTYDQYFKTLAQNLVNDGEANAILRLGWEFNGYWYPWWVQTATDAANFDRFWQQIVVTMRSVPGEEFKFLWSASADTGTSYTPAQVYPGNAYVDYVGTDVYDEFWGSPRTPAAAWSNQLTQQWGLDWLTAFAAQNGKPIAIPEWSVSIRSDGGGMGDDPTFVANMHAWFAAHHVAFDDIFSFDSPPGTYNDILDGQFPNSLAKFKAVFG